MHMTLIMMNSTQPRLLSWRIFPGMAQMHSLRYTNPDNMTYDLFNQSEQIMTSFEQSNDNSNSSTQQDVMILSMFEQLNTQVMNYTNVNLEYKSANKAMTTELDRYKEMQNVENSFSGSNEQYAEIERLKQTLSEQVQEKDSLMKTVSDLKNDLKMEENRNIDREIALEKKIKQLDNIIFKRGQSAQTKVRESKPKLYDRNVILKMDAIVIPNTDETLMLCDETLNIELEHRVTKLVAENEHLKQTYKQLDICLIVH
ncbi:hypothetical protein Tco_0069682 [Tanacetum coccineum]